MFQIKGYGNIFLFCLNMEAASTTKVENISLPISLSNLLQLSSSFLSDPVKADDR